MNAICFSLFLINRLHDDHTVNFIAKFEFLRKYERKSRKNKTNRDLASYRLYTGSLTVLSPRPNIKNSNFRQLKKILIICKILYTQEMFWQAQN